MGCVLLLVPTGKDGGQGRQNNPQHRLFEKLLNTEGA